MKSSFSSLSLRPRSRSACRLIQRFDHSIMRLRVKAAMRLLWPSARLLRGTGCPEAALVLGELGPIRSVGDHADVELTAKVLAVDGRPWRAGT